MAFVLAIAENQVPSTGAPDPYMHVFLDAGGGNVLAFFEIPSLPPMDRDRNTPTWVQHLADLVADRDTSAEGLAADFAPEHPKGKVLGLAAQAGKSS